MGQNGGTQFLGVDVALAPQGCGGRGWWWLPFTKTDPSGRAILDDPPGPRQHAGAAPHAGDGDGGVAILTHLLRTDDVPQAGREAPPFRC